MIKFTLDIIWSRNHAGLAASELALAIERHVLDCGSIDNVGTVGRLLLKWLD